VVLLLDGGLSTSVRSIGTLEYSKLVIGLLSNKGGTDKYSTILGWGSFQSLPLSSNKKQ
jgi:hypothetical protein